MLESTASELIAATDDLALNSPRVDSARRETWMYFPVIVTTAGLHRCRLDPSAINLRDGTVDTAAISPLPLVRFRKAFDSRTAMPLDKGNVFLGRTVLVASADSFVEEVLKKWQVMPADTLPWNNISSEVATEERIRQITTAFGALGDPPRVALRRVLEAGTLASSEIAAALEAHRLVSDGHSVDRIVNHQRDSDLIVRDHVGRWSVKDDARDVLRRCFDAPLSLRLLRVSDELREWLRQFSSSGGFDTNDFQQRFAHRIASLASTAKEKHSETEDWLSKQPSSVRGGEELAQALERLARRVP